MTDNIMSTLPVACLLWEATVVVLVAHGHNCARWGHRDYLSRLFSCVSKVSHSSADIPSQKDI